MLKPTLALLTLAASLYTSPAYAGTAASYLNRPLGFTLIVPAMSDDLIFTDEANHDLEFAKVRDQGKKTIYREKNRKCEISVEAFNKSFAEGRTKDEFMLNLDVQVVQIIKGKCTLEQQLPKQDRSLTGIYGF